MLLLIDNYDSFTYNLVQAMYALGREPTVCTNDDPRLLDFATRSDLSQVILSPGPSRPENAGLSLAFLAKLPPTVPVLGVCLGHQILGAYAGCRIIGAKTIMHGKQSAVTHTGKGLFTGLPSPLTVGRYHSLVVEEPAASASIPITVTARDDEGQVMALAYTDRPWVGVQFHPESILTPQGIQLLGNFPAMVTKKDEDEFSFKKILETVAQGQNLTRIQADTIFAQLMDGQLTQAQAGSLLLALRMKGETALELASATRILLARARTVPHIDVPHIDVVGTGGDNRSSFNCSTATALTLAGMGYKVTKHGNRAVSSPCGSADALEGLGFPLIEDPNDVAAQLEQKNFAFLFAPNFHPAFKQIVPVRRELGVRTFFNILGPLLNPAAPTHILLGVSQPHLVELIASALVELGQKRACVVMGAGNYDEITPIGPAQILEIRDGSVQPLPFNPAEYGIAPCTPRDLEVHSKREAVSVLTELLQGKGPAAMLDMITLNVALALHMLGDMTLALAVTRAREAVLQGAGGRVHAL